MKNILKFVMLTMIGFLLASCEKDEDRAIVGAGTQPILQASAQNLVLTKDNAAKEAIKFNFVTSDYGVNVIPNQELQFALKGTNFENAKSVVIPANTSSISYTVQEFNALMLGLGLPVNESAVVEVRLKSSLTKTSGVQYSEVIPLAVTPYALISYMYLPGAYQGWNPATANLLTSATSNGIYEGLISFKKINANADDFKFKITANKNWDTAYGTDDGKTLIKNGGADIAVANTYDTYKIVADINALTFTMALNSWGIIGSATPNGWDGPDFNMTWNQADKVYETIIPLTPGLIKFRFNDAWDKNYGMDAAEGQLKSGGADIPVTQAGTYKVVLDLNNLKYSVTKQ